MTTIEKTRAEEIVEKIPIDEIRKALINDGQAPFFIEHFERIEGI